MYSLVRCTASMNVAWSIVDLNPSSPSATRGWGSGKVSGAGGGGARPREAGQQHADLHRGRVVGAVQRGGVRALDVRVGDHEQAVLEIVEDQQAVGEHEHRVRQPEIVLGEAGQPLDMTDDVVG